MKIITNLQWIVNTLIFEDLKTMAEQDDELKAAVTKLQASQAAQTAQNLIVLASNAALRASVKALADQLANEPAPTDLTETIQALNDLAAGQDAETAADVASEPVETPPADAAPAPAPAPDAPTPDATETPAS